jgi:putative tryptophan/tyrosine transport system substrate-binding protein
VGRAAEPTASVENDPTATSTGHFTAQCPNRLRVLVYAFGSSVLSLGEAMRRRQFLTFLGAAAALPFAARAQEAGRTYSLGSLASSPRHTPVQVVFFDELRRHGFVEGQNLVRDANGYGLRVEQFADHVSELVKAQVDVIVAVGDAAIRAAQQATKTIPILANGTDLVSAGFVASLAKPAGNTTGFSILSADLNGKRQEVLIEAVPGLRRMAALADVNFTTPQLLQMLQDQARTRGVGAFGQSGGKTR